MEDFTTNSAPLGKADAPQALSAGSVGEPTAPAIDAATLNVMVDVLRQYDVAKNLNQEILEDICIEAWAAGKVNDFGWLEKKLGEVLGDEVSLDALPDSGDDSAVAIAEGSSRDVIERIQISPVSEIRSEEDMKEVLRLHEVWMNSVLNPRSEVAAYRANLKGANLSGFDLVGVNLSCADFRNATLIGANLRQANLSNAWLQGANLQGANLQHANLKRAKLDGADLRDADLEGVDMEAADFSKAVLKGRGPG